MLLPSYFIVELNKYDSIPDVQMPDNCYLAYKITTDSIDLIPSFYKNLFLFPPKGPFCLLLDISEESGQSQTMLELLVSVSFHFRYLKTCYDNPLMIFEVNQSESHEYISIVREAFKSQGYLDIETIFIYKTKNSLSVNSDKYCRINLKDNIEILSSEYINSIKDLTTSHYSFCYYLEHPENLPQVLKIIDVAESTIRKELPHTYSLLNEGNFLRLNEQELRSKLQLLEEQLGSLDGVDLNYNSTVDRYKKQITGLMKYYKLEYEILPLWYKRFGHILKVITGKRTFKSLFNDSAEKYKE